QEQDAQATIQALSDQSWDSLVVDHYALDARWENALRGTARQIMVIDDIADRQHDCDVLLDQNFYADMQTRYAGKVPSHCQLLLGPRYALLRDEFRRFRDQVKPHTGADKRILVFFGGVDADNYTGIAIKALAELAVKELHVDVVIGAQHPRLAEIEAACAVQGYVCHVQTSRMAELMVNADLAIGAGGSATWERCCLGLPALAFCTADNQQRQLADAAQQGLLYAPSIVTDRAAAIKRHTIALLENAPLFKLISNSAMQAVDGRGVLRVIAIIGCRDIEIRTARPDDSEKMFQWRNHPSIRKVSRNADMIDWQDHQRWFTAVLADPEKMLLIGQRPDSPVGVVRFDKQGDAAEVSIYLVPDAVSSGSGRSLLQSAEQWLALNHPEISKIRAHVLRTNERSQRLFSGAGYQIESTYYSKRLQYNG
ncbi:MAG: UDP-2,4-diacetamido-2,4,6-trideoxy-beta-L-altropyranose hydrolase, partial [Cellvibrio sp.]|uniref:UDP-2,4-diacetamido-2,4, 6-trideoxy-beta-L-altropyranose hydrolase n=1 Tax=Cellvibrio sp. TaxID=1965322 RepID=UPI0027255957|nr:UDP-2,4-diacetamido-2,4,6-trideoxy-beta-L-altropyranose hydrolase [Cellvibrio sp.]